MPRTEEANQRLRVEQRKKILNGAREVFARKGWTATMSDIAEAAGVSQGLAYRYFKNKEAIFGELVDQAKQAASFDQILDMSGTPSELLNILISRILDNRRERIEFYQILGQAIHDESIPEDFGKILRRQGQVFQDILKKLITEGQTTGEVASGDPEQLVIAVIACIDGLSRLALRGSEKIKNHFPNTEIILRMLKP